MATRFYLTGRIYVEAGDHIVDQQELPGPQGRLVFAFLVLERARPVPRDELGELLWPRKRPASWSTSLNALVSKLRAILDRVGIPGAEAITGAFGYYQLRLPPNVWIDIEAAITAIHQAESAIRAGDVRNASAPGAIAFHVAERPFLAELEGEWAASWRAKLRDILVRSLECNVEFCLANAEAPLAVQLATRVVELEPFRETGYQLLMRAHALARNPAEATRVFERCRRFLARELAVPPSAETRAVYQQILRSARSGEPRP